MCTIRYTLLSDGSSDKALIPILTWLLRHYFGNCAIDPNYADLRRLPRPPRNFSKRIITAVELFPCDLLFVHRDAEDQNRQMRKNEIEHAIFRASEAMTLPHVICVIPVRMGEAWLLFDEDAIRRASGNPNGHIPLDLPNIANLETLPNPKKILYELLQKACELRGRRLRKLNTNKCTHLVAEFIEDFASLRQLSAFIALELDVQTTSTLITVNLATPP
jgi:hypothetical protein